MIQQKFEEGSIDFTPELLEKFKHAYSEARANGDKEMKFEGCTCLTNYGFYLIEYLSTKFNKDEHRTVW